MECIHLAYLTAFAYPVLLVTFLSNIGLGYATLNLLKVVELATGYNHVRQQIVSRQSRLSARENEEGI